MLRLQAPLPDRYTLATPDELDGWIRAAKAALGDRLLILGHHYQRDEVIRWADARGDSFKLARFAADNDQATDIVFCGVHFMAESADILTGDHQRVILPDLNAGCSMADMADIDQVEEAWEELADVTDIDRVVPITYMNSSAALKAFVGDTAARCARRRTPRAVLEWALGPRRQGAVLPRPAPRAATPGYQMGYDEADMRVWNPHARPRRARRARRQGRDVPAVEGALLRAPALPARARRARSGPSTPTARSSCTPSARTRSSSSPTRSARPSASWSGSTQRRPGAVLGVGTEIHMVQRLAAEHPDKTVVLARSADLPVLDDVPHRRARTSRGASRRSSRARSSTRSSSTPTPPSGRGSRSSACSTSTLRRVAARPEQRAEPGDGGRRPRYSVALGRGSPGRWRGSSMRSNEPDASAIAFTYCDSGRCTNGSTTPGASSSIVTSSGRYGPTRQYCSSRMWSITQPLFGRLQQRVVQEEHEAPARLEHPRDLGDRAARDRRCARTRGTRPRRRSSRRRTAARRPRPRDVPRATAALGRDGELRRASGRRRRPVGADRRTRQPARPAPHRYPTSSTRPRAGQALGREREDLLLVLGVGAVGEPVLPPAGVLLPEVGRRGFGRDRARSQGNERPPVPERRPATITP